MNDNEDHAVILPFALGREWYAASVNNVLEVLKPPPVTIVPNVSSIVLGVVNIRGNITSVVDLKRLLAIPEAPFTSESRVVVVKAAGKTTGLLTDCVGSVMSVPRSSLQPVLSTIPEPKSKYVKGELALQDGRLLAVLDLNQVMESEEFAEVSSAMGAVSISG